jgi:hypothetical protein
MTEDVTSIVQPLEIALVGHGAEQVVGRRKGDTGGARKLLGLRTPIELGHYLQQPQCALHGLDQRWSSCLFGHPPGPSVTRLSVGRTGEVVYANAAMVAARVGSQRWRAAASLSVPLSVPLLEPVMSPEPHESRATT